MSGDRRNTEQQTGGQSLIEAFRCAGKGFVYTCLSQRNMKIHLVFSALAIILGFVLQIDIVGWLAVLGCIFLVVSAECINTAIESVVDLVSPEYSESAGHAKDCAAAAVLVLAVFALVVAAIVFGSALLRMI